jgi:hypothetical protein
MLQERLVWVKYTHTHGDDCVLTILLPRNALRKWKIQSALRRPDAQEEWGKPDTMEKMKENGCLVSAWVSIPLTIDGDWG